MNFAKFSLGAFALTAMLVACDSDSASAKDTELEELSSSSAVEIASSSSTIRHDSLSSSAIESSSSSAIEIASSSSTIRNDNSSSSSETTQSSSSTAAPCNVDGENNCNYGTLTDTRDGQTYKTVIIGTQTWMAENLNYADSVTTASLKGKSWCYNDVAANCDVGGRLYTWAAAMDSVKLATDADNPLDCGYGKTCGLSGKVQGVCPEGWHLPSYDEWNTLFTAVGGQSTAGKVLKSQTGWDESGNGTDAFGFSALPAGYRNYTGGYGFEGLDAFFWSSTEDLANCMDLYFYDDYAAQGNDSKYTGRSVRCLKD